MVDFNLNDKQKRIVNDTILGKFVMGQKHV